MPRIAVGGFLHETNTFLLRRFDDPGFGFSRLTHVVESSVGYQYVPWVDQQSFLQFDRLDFVNPQNRVTYRLASRLMGRSKGPSGEAQTYEVANLSVTQSVNLQPKTREFSDVYLQALTPERVDQAVENLQPPVERVHARRPSAGSATWCSRPACGPWPGSASMRRWRLTSSGRAWKASTRVSNSDSGTV